MHDAPQTRADQLVALARPAIRKLTGSDLTPAEEKFLRAVAEGQIADFSSQNDQENDPANAGQWPLSRVLSADCIAWLCTNPDAARFLTHRGIFAQGVRIDGELDLQFARVNVPLAFGKCAFPAEISLRQADLQSLTLDGTHVEEIAADAVRVKGHLFLRNGFKATGEVWLTGASIGGNLECVNGQFSNPGNRALSADGVKVAGGAFFCDGFRAEGEVRLLRAAVAKDLTCANAQFSNPSGTALNCDGAEIEGEGLFCDGFRSQGEVSLLGASIGGNLDCSRGQFCNPSGRALSADGIRVEGSVFLRDGFKAEGEVRLLNAFTGRNLDCLKGGFSSPDKRALSADGAKIEGSVFMRDGLKADGTICFNGAEIGGQFQWRRVRNPEKLTLDLRSARLKTLCDEKASWPPKNQLYLQGFVYEELHHQAPASAEDRIDWLSRNNDEVKELPNDAPRSEKRAFFAQPYEQLARVLRNAGQDDDADEILIEKNRRIAQWTRKWSANWWWYRVLGPPIKYGYRPMVTFKWSLLVILIGTLLFGFGYERGLVTPTAKDAYEERDGKPTQIVREDYPRFNSIIYSTEMFVPLVKLYQAEYWLPNANREALFLNGHMKFTGGFLRGYLWLHICLGWTLTTIWVAGLTGIIKKSD